MEEYKTINNFPKYEVSNHGNVRNIKTQKVLKPQVVKSRYDYVAYNVTLFNDSSKKGIKPLIHRLVAIHFLPNPENKPIIDHIDRNTANNHVSNLRWATHSENNMNTDVRKDNKLGHKNICFNTNQQQYRVEVLQKHVGYFKTLEEAIQARDDYIAGKIDAPKQTSSTNHKNIYYIDTNKYNVAICRNGKTFTKRTTT